MKITVINGQSHKGSTYNITKQIINKISNDNTKLNEYFMPTDAPDYCVGCYKCFDESEYNCPHAQKVQRIVKSMEESDVIIINSPTYCYGMTGQLKTFLDHLGYMWLPHRPKEAMFDKVGITVSTASGAGANKVIKAIKQQMFWLGISNVFSYSKNVNAANWESVSDEIKLSIDKDLNTLSNKIKPKINNSKPNLKLKFMFEIMRSMQKGNDWNLTDKNYWIYNGWLDKKKPW